MAKKQTLKSLLGGADGRVQASLNLAPKKIQPTIGGVAGTTPPTVQSVQRAESTPLGQLASSLSKINPALQSFYKGYQTEAEFQKETFKERFAGLTDDERRELINAQKKDLDNTEAQINQNFRGDVGLNPLASIYAEKYLGAAKNTEASVFMANQIEAYKKEIEKLPATQKPSQVDIQARVEGFVDQYNEQGGEDGGQLFEKGSLRYRGLLSATRNKVDHLKMTLPKVLEDHHKDVVFLPNMANVIRSIALDLSQDTVDDTGQPLVDKTDLAASLKGLNVLDIPDTQKVLEMVVDGFAAEDGEYAEAVISKIAEVAKIGNEPLSSNIGFYNSLLERAESKLEAFEAQRTKEDERTIKAFTAQNRNSIEEAMFGVKDPETGEFVEGSQEKAEGVILQILKNVNEADNLSEDAKDALKAFYENELDDLNNKQDRAINAMSNYYSAEMSHNAISGSSAVMENVYESLAEVTKGFPNITQSSNDILIAPFEESSRLEQVLSPDALQIIGRHTNKFYADMSELERAAIRQGLLGDAARADYVVQGTLSENGLKDKFKKGLVKDLIAYQTRKAQIAQEKEAENTARDAQVQQASDNLAQITKDKLTVSDGVRGTDESLRVDTFSFFSTKRTNELIKQFYATGDYLALNPDERTEKLVPEAYDKILNYASDNLPSLLNQALERKRPNARFIKTPNQRAESIKNYQDAKACVGYGTKEIIDIIESGDVPDTEVSYDANGVPYAKDYFKEGYKEIKIIDLEDNPANVTKLAEFLGISELQLKKSQEIYRNKYFIK